MVTEPCRHAGTTAVRNYSRSVAVEFQPWYICTQMMLYAFRRHFLTTLWAYKEEKRQRSNRLSRITPGKQILANKDPTDAFQPEKLCVFDVICNAPRLSTTRSSALVSVQMYNVAVSVTLRMRPDTEAGFTRGKSLLKHILSPQGKTTNVFYFELTSSAVVLAAFLRFPLAPLSHTLGPRVIACLTVCLRLCVSL